MSKIELFAKIVKGFYLLTSLAKSTVLDVWQGSEYVCALEVRNTLIHLLVRNRVKRSRINAVITETNKQKSKAILVSFGIYKATVVTTSLRLRYLNITRKLK